jgi:cytochrome c biogenesis protein CcmG/thiol:disulfide interchange protein DsbE
MKHWKLLLPLAIFLILVIVLGRGLSLDPREVPSPLLGKTAPPLTLPRLDDAEREFKREDLLGKVWMLNVWASWCVACREEHPELLALAKRGLLPIYGLNYKDKREDGLAWLNNFGNPYLASAFDAKGRAGIDWGVYGVPETFIIDQQGFVRLKHIGPLTAEVIRTKVEPLLKQLQN